MKAGELAVSIVISQTNALNEFNEKIGHANELNQRYQAAKKLDDEKGGAELGELGLSAHDFGRAE